MKKVDFVLTDRDALPFEALKHLQNAAKRSQEDLWKTLTDGKVYIIKRDKIIGCLYLEFHPDIMNITLLGGDNIREWRDDLVDFLIGLMRKKKLSHICVLGRNGWGGLFKELQPIGMLYVFKDEGGVRDAGY